MIAVTVRTLLLGALALGIAGCGYRSVVDSAGTAPAVPVKVIAIASSGLLADAVAVQLVKRGFTIIDVGARTNRMRRENMREIETVEPQTMAQLRERGVDAVLQVRTTVNRRAELINATARLTSVRDNTILAVVSWANGDDDGLLVAADAIAKDLEARLRPAS